MEHNNYTQLAQILKGKYICLEGLDGSGKTTLTNYIKELLGEQVVSVREPGGTEVGEEIRNILLNHKSAKLQSLTELMLFSACRIEILHQIALPALAKHKTIWSDRCYWSTYAYQCCHNKLFSLDEFNQFMKLIYKQYNIDIFIYCKIDPRVGLERAGKIGAADNFESRGLDYYCQTAQGYMDLINSFKVDCDLIEQHLDQQDQMLWAIYRHKQTNQILVELDAMNISQAKYGESLVQALLTIEK